VLETLGFSGERKAAKSSKSGLSRTAVTASKVPPIRPSPMGKVIVVDRKAGWFND